MLVIIAFRNLIELSGTEFDFAEGFVLPKSFGWFRGNNVLWTISYVSLPGYNPHFNFLKSNLARVHGASMRDAS
jgi:hypothetical protein